MLVVCRLWAPPEYNTTSESPYDVIEHLREIAHLLGRAVGPYILPYSHDGNEDDRAAGQHPAEDNGPAGIQVGPVIGQLRVAVDTHPEHHLQGENIHFVF